MPFQTACVICGDLLVYEPQAREMTCAVCGRKLDSEISCINGHFVCESCHNMAPADFIEQQCITAMDTDPVSFGARLMRSSKIRVHGPEHHFIVPAALLTTYYNFRGDWRTKREMLAEAHKRSDMLPPGACGYHGACGAAVGSGIFISIITGATPVATLSWSQSNKATANALQLIAENGGPRCCKRDAFLSIISTVKFLDEQFSIKLPATLAPRCEFDRLNRDCRITPCPFHGNDRQLARASVH